MSFGVVFAPEAEVHLANIYRYVAERASPDVAAHYTEAIVTCCQRLELFPHRGTARDDLRPGLRLTHHKGRVVIAYVSDETRLLVTILGVYYGGQDHEVALRTPDDN